MSSLVQFIPDLLSAEQCAEFVELSEQHGFIKQRFGVSIPPEIRYRVAIDDPSSSDVLWDLLEPRLLSWAGYFDDALREQMDVHADDYFPFGLNDRLRFYKYHEEERFAPHFDIPFEKSECERSLLSVVIYLNDDFTGGETVFDAFQAQPKTGAAIVFAHELIHEGCPVNDGVKRVLRTDVMGRLQSLGGVNV